MAEGQLSPEVYSFYDGGRSVMLRFDGEDFAGASSGPLAILDGSPGLTP